MTQRSTDEELVSVLTEMRKLYPEWRFGQLVANVATWARGAKPSAVWDIEDEQFIAVARAHIEKQTTEMK